MTTRCDNFVECPHCGYEHDDTFEFHDGSQYTCDECMDDFILVSTEKTYTFTTIPATAKAETEEDPDV